MIVKSSSEVVDGSRLYYALSAPDEATPLQKSIILIDIIRTYFITITYHPSFLLGLHWRRPLETEPSVVEPQALDKK